MAESRGARSCLVMTESMNTIAPLIAFVNSDNDVFSSSSSFSFSFSLSVSLSLSLSFSLSLSLSPPSPESVLSFDTFVSTYEGVRSSASRSCASRPSNCALCSWSDVRETPPPTPECPGVLPTGATILTLSGLCCTIPSTLLTI